MMANFLTFWILLGTFFTTVIWAEAGKSELRTLHRQKREWIIPPKRLKENVDYTRDEYIAKIRSDEETRSDIEYSLTGPAVDAGLFSVDRKKGYVKIHGILDREQNETYTIKGRATFRNGALAETDLDLKIIVVDQNDNAPVFNVQIIGDVDELSDENTMVIEITAFDADEQGTPNSKIAYKVVQQEPDGEMMFKIERSSGKIVVKMNSLDREKQETYKLIITGTDMDGSFSDFKNRPLTGTGTVTINVRDVNDNVPVLEKNSYEGSVQECIRNVEAIRIKATDKDKPHTENWEAVYTIISGNEAGFFSIITDPKTNEGILTVSKELDYEELKEVNLKVVVRNKAPYHKSVVNYESKIYPIKISVVNVPEAPHFQPVAKVVSISEDSTSIDLTKVITTYTATDSDTLLTATNVRYVKGEDVDNWVSINEQTAEIRLNKYPDRESKFLVNGTYYVKVLCITDEFASKTVTGTLAIQVQDFNDHCPILSSSVQKLCDGEDVVYVTATDGDKFPNAEPFEFRVVTEDSKENWVVERVNETSVLLRSQETLWLGPHTVWLEVTDQQGKSCEVQTLQVDVCTCTKEQVCRPVRQIGSGTVLGSGGLLPLFLGILLLLLIPVLLLLCKCGEAAAVGNFQDFPFKEKALLISYNTEGQAEDKELVLLPQMPIHVAGGSSNGNSELALAKREDWRKYRWESREEYMNNQWHVDQYGSDFGKRRHSEHLTMSTLDYMGLPEAFLGNYYIEKSQDMVMQETSMNYLLVSYYETCNSVTSSLDDVSAYVTEYEDLGFLDDLGPKFKLLAEICSGPTIELDVNPTPEPPKTISSSSQVGNKVEGAVVGVHSEAASVSASSSSSTTQITTVNHGESIISGGTTSSATAGQTLLVQQPTVYLSSTPMYVVEQQRHPTLLLASGPMLGVQESNVVLVEKGGTNMAIAAQNTLPSLGLQQANTILVDPGIGSRIVHGFSSHSEPQGTVHVIESQRLQSREPVYVAQSSSHSSISKSHSMQAEGQSGGIMTLGNASFIPSQFAVANGGTHKEVREERVSVVEKSFQSSSTS